jgi:hypothetical protein
MPAITIKQRVIRFSGIAALATGLVFSSGVAAAMPSQVGLTECDHAGCTIVTAQHDATRILADYDPPPSGSAGGPLCPHLVP